MGTKLPIPTQLVSAWITQLTTWACIAIPRKTHPENIPMKLNLRISVTFISLLSLLQHNREKKEMEKGNRKESKGKEGKERKEKEKKRQERKQKEKK
jgi:hypothetical protein